MVAVSKVVGCRVGAVGTKVGLAVGSGEGARATANFVLEYANGTTT